jgi:hypothetical protein
VSDGVTFSRHVCVFIPLTPSRAPCSSPVAQNPNLALVYTEHTHAVKSAKFAPTGKFVASGGALTPHRF